MLGKIREQAREVLEPVESKADRLTAALLFTGFAILILAMSVILSAH
jgi:hypothetical protein